MKKNEKKAVEVVAEPSFYLLWNPAHPSPPKVRFATLDEARRIARALAERDGSTMYILKAGECFGPPTAVVHTKLK